VYGGIDRGLTRDKVRGSKAGNHILDSHVI
jgi:hypothetical protein